MTHARVRAIVAVVASLLASALLGPVPATASPAGPTDAILLRVEIESTSDWAVVRLSPGQAMTQRTVASQGGDVTANGLQWGLERWQLASRARATIDVVLYDPAAADEFELSIDKGWAGEVAVRIVDVQGARVVTEVTNATQTLFDPNNRVSWQVARPDLFAQPIDLPRADGRPLVLAFYYPWFGADSYDDPRMTDRPAEPRSTWTRAGVDAMTRQAADHGIDGFVVSWAGESHDGTAFDLALAAAEQQGQLITGYLEAAQAAEHGGNGNPTLVADWITQLVRRSSSHAFLTWDGRPVLFVFGMTSLSPTTWRAVRVELERRGIDPLLVGDTLEPAYADISWGEHLYTATGDPGDRARKGRERALLARTATLVHGAPIEPWVATVAPGYDDHLVRSGNEVVTRDGGARYEAMWDAAVYSDPDWIVVTSWNEWYEGTAVEPSVTHGDLALRQTAERAGRWRAGRVVTVPPDGDDDEVTEEPSDDGLLRGLIPLTRGQPVADAVSLSRLVFPADGSARTAVVAGDHAFADGLASQALAGRDGPVLFVPGGPAGTAPGAVVAELDRAVRADGSITIVGGTNAVSPAVEDALRQLGRPVTRLGGSDRIETALLIGREVARNGAPPHVLLARGDDWADALAGGAYAAATGAPLLLAWPDRLPDSVRDQIAAWQPQRVTLLGGTAALSPVVADTVPAATRRVAGVERSATAAEIARVLWGRRLASDGDPIVVIDGYSPPAWAATLAAGPLAATVGAPALLTHPTAVPDGTRAYLRDLDYAPGRAARVAQIPPLEETPRRDLAALLGL